MFNDIFNVVEQRCYSKSGLEVVKRFWWMVFFCAKATDSFVLIRGFQNKSIFAAGGQRWWVWSLFKNSLFVALNKKEKQSVLAWLEAAPSIKLKTVLICIFLLLVQPTAAAFVSHFTSGLDVKAAALVWVHVCVGECLHQRRLLMKYDLRKKKSFLSALSSLNSNPLSISRYQIHPNRC